MLYGGEAVMLCPDNNTTSTHGARERDRDRARPGRTKRDGSIRAHLDNSCRRGAKATVFALAKPEISDGIKQD